MVVWNGDPFSLSSHPILVIGEGRTVYDEPDRDLGIT